LRFFSIKRLYKASFYSLAGFKTVLKQETAFQQECLLSILIVPLAFYLGASRLESLVLCLSWLFIPFAELINSAIERCINRVSTDLHPISKEAKDIGSACVLFSIITAILTWGVILFPSEL